MLIALKSLFFIHPLFHSSIRKYLLTTYYVVGTAQSARGVCVFIYSFMGGGISPPVLLRYK